MSLLSTLRVRAGKSTLTDSLVAAAGIIAMESVRAAVPSCDSLLEALPYGLAVCLLELACVQRVGLAGPR